MFRPGYARLYCSIVQVSFDALYFAILIKVLRITLTSIEMELFTI